MLESGSKINLRYQKNIYKKSRNCKEQIHIFFLVWRKINMNQVDDFDPQTNINSCVYNIVHILSLGTFGDAHILDSRMVSM